MFWNSLVMQRPRLVVPGWRSVAALALAAAAMLPIAATAEPGDEDCFRQFYKYGHWPTEPACPTSTAATPVGLGLFYCTGTGGAVQRFCMNDVANAGGPSDPPTPPPPEQCTTYVGNPIHAGNHNKYQYEIDIEGAGSMPLDFARHYNSISGYADGVLGSSWRHSYSRKLLVSDTTQPETVAAMVSAERVDGKIWQFKQAVDGTWPPISGDILPRLVELKSGSTRTGWELRDFGTGNVEVYNASGRLDRITRADGAALVMAYDTSGRLSTVTDSITGRQLTFEYSSTTNLMTSVTAPDGQTHRFGYDSNFPPNLATVTRPDDTPGNATDNPVRTYLYDEPAYSADVSVMHLLTGIQDERGNRYATFRYDVNRAAIGTEHAGGTDSNSLAYSGSTSTVTTPLGAQIALTFTTINGRKLPASASQPACAGGLAVKNFSYDANANVIARQDFRGTRSCSAFDANRRLETIRVEGLAVACPANLAAYTPPTPASPTDNVVVRKTMTQWHPFWHLKAREASPKRITTWVYNGQPDPTNGNAILSCAPAGSTVAGQPLAVLCKRVEQATTDETGGQGFNATAIGLARVWQYSYNANGQRVIANGPRTDVGDSTAWTYYATTDLSGCSSVGGACRRAGDLWKTTNALNQITEIISYDMAGRIARFRDPNATISDRSYDGRGWLKDSTIRANANGNASPLDAITSTRYIATGEIERIIRPDGTYTRYEYDTARRLTDVVDPAGNRVHYRLDDAGNRVGESLYDNTYNPSMPTIGLKRSISSSFDQLSRLKQVRDALNRPIVTYQRSLATQSIADGYDDNGNAVHTIDGNGTQGDLSYDALNRLIETIADLQGTDPSTKDSTTQIAYDARGNVRKFADADGVVTTYQSDGFDQQTAVTSPDSGPTSFVYDAAGNQVSKTDGRGVVSTSVFDALNRPIGIFYPTSSENVTYGYDEADSITDCSGSYPIGHLTTISDSSGTTTYCYDRRGNITAKTQATIGKTFTVAYTYTKASDLESVTYPGGSIATYSRDAVGRINTVSWKLDAVAPPVTIASAISYYPFGPANALIYGNGRSLIWTYDKNYAIDSIVSSALDGLSIDFSTDVMGSITTVNESSIVRKYVHDRLGRLTRVDDASNVLQEGFTYTKGGDRILKQRIGEASQTSTYVPGTHRLDSVDGVFRTYDNNGNTTDLGNGEPRTYDDRNQLVEFGAGLFHAYTYTAKGERVMSVRSSPSFPGGRSRFVYDESGLLLSQRSFSNLDKPTGSLDHIYVNATPIAQVVNGAISYLEADHLGTPRIAAKPSTNAQQWSWSYSASAFGDHEATNAPIDSTDVILRYAGQVNDGEGIYYNYLRNYESATGRYVESDRIGINGGPNSYAYASSSPLRYIDPTGMEPNGWGCLAGGVIGTTIGAIVGGAICWETGPGLLVCAGEGAALGGGLLGCGAGMATPWPQDDLTPLEKRAFSRHCLFSPDPCGDLKAAAKQAIAAAHVKMNAMLVDDKKMYLNHFATKWTNHANDLRGRLESIAAMISLGQKINCDMSEEIALAATLFIPLRPL